MQPKVVAEIERKQTKQIYEERNNQYRRSIRVE